MSEQNLQNQQASELLHRWKDEGKIRQGENGVEIIEGSSLVDQEELSEPMPENAQQL